MLKLSKEKAMKFNSEETATILAALRFFQASFPSQKEVQANFPLHFGEMIPLSSTQINELCERINCQNK